MSRYPTAGFDYVFFIFRIRCPSTFLYLNRYSEAHVEEENEQPVAQTTHYI
jgi:hypothetical protein